MTTAGTVEGYLALAVLLALYGLPSVDHPGGTSIAVSVVLWGLALLLGIDGVRYGHPSAVVAACIALGVCAVGAAFMLFAIRLAW